MTSPFPERAKITPHSPNTLMELRERKEENESSKTKEEKSNTTCILMKKRSSTQPRKQDRISSSWGVKAMSA